MPNKKLDCPKCKGKARIIYSKITGRYWCHTCMEKTEYTRNITTTHIKKEKIKVKNNGNGEKNIHGIIISPQQQNKEFYTLGDI